MAPKNPRLTFDRDERSASIKVNSLFGIGGRVTLDELIAGLQLLRDHAKRGDLPVCFATQHDYTLRFSFATLYRKPTNWEDEPAPPYVALS
jgi:hypothetical protein